MSFFSPSQIHRAMSSTIVLALLFSGLIALSACSSIQTKSPPPEEVVVEPKVPTVLIFSKTTGYRHKSIDVGIGALSKLARSKEFTVITTEDAGFFTDEKLKDVDVVILLNTTSRQKKHGDREWFAGEYGEAFQRFVRRGGGVLGIHGAADSHYKWPWYGQLIGGYFESHPKGVPTGILTVVDAEHPSTASMPASFSHSDEWYRIKDFNPEVSLLLTLDPKSIGEKSVNPKPISWSQEFDGGRAFYTTLGHTKAVYSNPLFLDHMSGALDWLMEKEPPVPSEPE